VAASRPFPRLSARLLRAAAFRRNPRVEPGKAGIAVLVAQVGKTTCFRQGVGRARKCFGIAVAHSAADEGFW
jgi:hypothetical protein